MDKLQATQLVDELEKKSIRIYRKIEKNALINQEKVLDAFRELKVSLQTMQGSTGYGYEDIARPKLCELYAMCLNAEKAFVSPNITCGTHALYLALSAVLRPGDLMLSVTGDPYDTMQECILGEGNGSLKDFNISFSKVEMIGSKVNLKKCIKVIEKLKPKLIYIQRSRGYSKRKTLTVSYIGEIISSLRQVSPQSIFMVDNCYGEFVETIEPTAVGADLIAGSLIKNIGGGLAPTGGYVAGKADLVDLAAKRLTAPSLGDEIGSYNSTYLPFFEGLFIAPHVVANVLKGNVLLGKVAKACSFKTSPEPNHIPEDIIRTIEFNNESKFIDFVKDIQKLSPIDSFVVPEPWDMPGYTDKVIMAAGTFVQGSSIEFSCDGPVKPPYIAYMQGGLTYEHIKLIAIMLAQKNL